jgi:hypothetical protein
LPVVLKFSHFPGFRGRHSAALAPVDAWALRGSVHLLSEAWQLEKPPGYAGAAAQPGDGSPVHGSYVDGTCVVAEARVREAEIIAGYDPSLTGVALPREDV